MLNTCINYKQSRKYEAINKDTCKSFLDTLKPLLEYRQLIFYKNGEKKYKVYIKGDKLLGLRCLGSKGHTECQKIELTDADITRLLKMYACVDKYKVCYRHESAYLEVDYLNNGLANETQFITVYDNSREAFVPNGCSEVTGELRCQTSYFALHM